MKTRADLVLETLDILGITATGQTVDADTAAIVDKDVEVMFKQAAARELVYIADYDNIPEEVFHQVAHLLADMSSHNFGLQTDELDRLDRAVTEAESQLREIVRGRPTYERLRQEYF